MGVVSTELWEGERERGAMEVFSIHQCFVFIHTAHEMPGTFCVHFKASLFSSVDLFVVSLLFNIFLQLLLFCVALVVVAALGSF